MCIITGTQTNRERCLKNHVFTSWKRGVCIVYMYQKSQQDAWRQASGSSGTVWVTFCFEVAMAFMKMLLWHITNLSMVTVHIQHFTVIVVGSFKKNNAELHPHPQKNDFFQEYEKLLILPSKLPRPHLKWTSVGSGRNKRSQMRASPIEVKSLKDLLLRSSCLIPQDTSGGVVEPTSQRVKQRGRPTEYYGGSFNVIAHWCISCKWLLVIRR